MGSVALVNYGTIKNSLNSGDISVVNKNEQGVYAMLGGIAYDNIGTIQKCKNTGNVSCDATYTIARMGSICADTEIDSVIPTIKECAALGTLSISVENDNSVCYVGGLVGRVFNPRLYTYSANLTDNYSAIQTSIKGTYSYIFRGGIVGLWPVDSKVGFLNNAYLQSSMVPYGLYVVVQSYWVEQYQEVVSADGLFMNYENMSDIEALEIYW